eukprot:m.353463 g.353463  ORF g.353463 m.353463 type:complete len:119 (-) comp55923_c0_seq6:2437-2793(-)
MRERVMQLARRAWHALTWRQLVLRARSVNRDILFDSVVMLLFGVLNNVAVSMMSFAMPGYPSFINYFPCILYAPALLVLLDLDSLALTFDFSEFQVRAVLLCLRHLQERGGSVRQSTH